ncbi:MAG TPA: DegV family protein, partial [Conexibacter sp.]|nr:DegV family protein [Conexibacter sp.]
MGSVAVVTDTCHYLPRQLVAARGIHEVSLYVHWDGREDREAALPDFDGYYGHLRKAKQLPTTSQPSIGDFLAVYEPLLARGDEIVSIHLSGAISGTFASAQQARDQLAGSDGERVHVIDSQSACGGQGLVVLAAHAAAARGA